MAMFKAFVSLQDNSAVSHLVSDARKLPQVKTTGKHGLGIQREGELLWLDEAE